MLAQVGARFERPSRMEWCHMMVDSIQNTAANGYGDGERAVEEEDGAAAAAAAAAAASTATTTTTTTTRGTTRQAIHDRKLLQTWANFYGLENFPTFEEAKNDDTGRFVPYKGLARSQAFFDTLVYERRMDVAAETMLLEANAQAASVCKKAACHIVGLGAFLKLFFCFNNLDH